MEQAWRHAVSVNVRSRRGRRPSGRGVAGVRALVRGLSILECLAGERELSLTQLASRLQLPGSTTYRLLETLKARGFVAQSPETGLYRLGIRAFEVGGAFLARWRLHELALPAMRALSADVGETVNLAVADGREAVYVGQVEGPQLVRMFTQIGARTPLYCTGVGKALLAWRSEQEVRQLFDGVALRPYTPNTLTSLEALLGELARVRAQGYAVDREERELGVRCVAAPVRDRSGQVVAAISVSAPPARLSDARIPEVARRVMAGAGEISVGLGFRAAPL